MTRDLADFTFHWSLLLPQKRLLLAVLDIVEVAVRVSSEGNDRQSVASATPRSQGDDGLSPDAFTYRSLLAAQVRIVGWLAIATGNQAIVCWLVSAQGYSDRSTSLLAKASAYLHRWRGEAFIPRVTLSCARGRLARPWSAALFACACLILCAFCSWSTPVDDAHLNCCLPVSVVVLSSDPSAASGAGGASGAAVAGRPNPMFMRSLHGSPTISDASASRAAFEAAEDVAATSSIVGPNIPAPSFPRLLQLLRAAGDAEKQAAQASLREAHFLALVQHGITQV